MAERKPPSLRRQAELMETAEERKSGYLREWLKNPEFRAALHRHDSEMLRRNITKKVATA